MKALDESLEEKIKNIYLVVDIFVIFGILCCLYFSAYIHVIGGLLFLVYRVDYILRIYVYQISGLSYLGYCVD